MPPRIIGGVWVAYSLLTVLFWGLWGFFVKLASRHLHWSHLYVLSNLAAFLLSAYLLATSKEFPRPTVALFYAILAGVTGTAGYLSFILATKTGKISIIVPLTATYPVVTFLLGTFLLREDVHLRHILGMLLAVAGAVLLSL